VLDWSTWNGSTILGYYRVIQLTSTWNTFIDTSISTSYGGYSNCRGTNNVELFNIFNYQTATTRLNYAPFNFGTTNNLWTTNTVPINTPTAYRWATGNASFVATNKTLATGDYLVCRTFSLSTSNVLS
jgi:hypothetical protein